jgi:hypothetical protein
MNVTCSCHDMLNNCSFSVTQQSVTHCLFHIYLQIKYLLVGRFMVFNASFNNISATNYLLEISIPFLAVSIMVLLINYWINLWHTNFTRFCIFQFNVYAQDGATPAGRSQNIPVTLTVNRNNFTPQFTNLPNSIRIQPSQSGVFFPTQATDDDTVVSICLLSYWYYILIMPKMNLSMS